MQDSPPGAAVTALNARIDGLEPQAADRAMEDDRSLVRTWAMRGAPFVVPTEDLPVFTSGVLPVDEDARTNLVYGVRSSLEHLSVGLDEVVAASGEAVCQVLAGERLEINELGRRVAEAVASTLSDDDRRPGTPRDRMRRASRWARPSSTSAFGS